MSAETEALQAAAAQLYALLLEIKRSNLVLVHGVDVGPVNHVMIQPTPAVTSWTDDLIVVANVGTPNIAPDVDLQVSNLPAIPIVVFDDTSTLPGDLDGVAVFKIQGTGTPDGPKAKLLFLGPAAYARRFPNAAPGAIRPIVYDEVQNKFGAAIGTPTEIRTGAADDVVVTPKGLLDAHAFSDLADAATVVWDLNSGWNKRVAKNGSGTIGTPTNLKNGAYIVLAITHATAGNVIAFASGWDFGAAGAPRLSTAIGKVDVITGVVLSVDPPLIRAGAMKG